MSLPCRVGTIDWLFQVIEANNIHPYDCHVGLVRPMERPPSSQVSLHHSRDHEQAHEGKKNRWAAAGQAVLNPSLQKEQGFPNSMGRSHFPR